MLAPTFTGELKLTVLSNVNRTDFPKMSTIVISRPFVTEGVAEFAVNLTVDFTPVLPVVPKALAPTDR